MLYILLSNLMHANRPIRMTPIRYTVGLVIDIGLTMSDHVTAVCHSAYYSVRTIARSLSDDAKKTLI